MIELQVSNINNVTDLMLCFFTPNLPIKIGTGSEGALAASIGNACKW